MLEVTRHEYNVITSSEMRSLIQKKFLRVSYRGVNYCFKVMAVREILEKVIDLREFKINNNIYGMINHDNTLLPVIGLGSVGKEGTDYKPEKYLIIIMDVISNGLLTTLGIIANNVHHIYNAVMCELSEEIIL